jgi:hypothetical protein
VSSSHSTPRLAAQRDGDFVLRIPQPVQQESAGNAPASRDRRASVRDAKDADGRDAFSDEANTDGLARPCLQSHAGHEYHRHPTAPGSNEGIVALVRCLRPQCTGGGRAGTHSGAYWDGKSHNRLKQREAGKLSHRSNREYSLACDFGSLPQIVCPEDHLQQLLAKALCHASTSNEGNRRTLGDLSFAHPYVVRKCCSHDRYLTIVQIYAVAVVWRVIVGRGRYESLSWRQCHGSAHADPCVFVLATVEWICESLANERLDRWFDFGAAWPTYPLIRQVLAVVNTTSAIWVY